jgi:hypothetical protein
LVSLAKAKREGISLEEVVVKYKSSRVPLNKLQTMIDEELAAVLADPEAVTELKELGLDIGSSTSQPTLTVDHNPGIAPLLFAIVLAYGADWTTKGGMALWRRVEERLKQRKDGGGDIVGDEEHP